VSVVRGGALERENSLNHYACGLQTEKERVNCRFEEGGEGLVFTQWVWNSESNFKQTYERGKWRKRAGDICLASRSGGGKGESEQKVQSWKFTFIIHILT
jgi:hypothetical protein